MLKDELVDVCQQMSGIMTVVEQQKSALAAVKQQIIEVEDEKYYLATELASVRAELQNEQQSAEAIIQSLQDVITRRRPGNNAAMQTEPVVDVAVAQLRAQVSELEQQLRANQATLAARTSELHQHDGTERRLKQFAQELQRAAMEKTQQLEIAVRDGQAATHRAVMAEHENAALQKEIQNLKYLMDRKAKGDGGAGRVRDEAALVMRVQVAEQRQAAAEADSARLRELLQSMGVPPPPPPILPDLPK